MVKKTSRIRFLLRNRTLIKQLLLKRKLKNLSFNTLESINQIAKYKFNYSFDCCRPKSFNECLSWIKLNYRNDLWKKCADKLGSKEFLKEIGLAKYVVKTLGVYKNSSEINLSKLPQKFVLKTNHDCGTVFLCDKETTDFSTVFKSLDTALGKKYYSSNNEWVYEDIQPVIFAEEVIIPKNGKLIDYKIHSYGGKYGWGFAAQGRNIDTRFSVFEGDYELQNVDYIYLRPAKKYLPPKPNAFSEMVEISNKISKILDFVRVDFYDTIDGPKIGELTFITQSGMGPFTKKKYDFKYGEYFNFTNIFKK